MSKQIDRAFKIIEEIAEHNLLSINEIHKKTEIPVSSVFKLLVDLENIGYVSREKYTKEGDCWVLTLKFLEISRLILSKIHFQDEIRDVLLNLSKEVKEIVQLGVYDNGKFMYIDVIKNPNSIISYLGIGAEFPFNACAAGMVLAASLPEEELNKLLKNADLTKKTPNTITDTKEIKKMLRKVAEDGYAYDNEYFYIGVRCLAAPVYNFEGKVIGAINITGHISSFSDERINYLRMKLIKASEEASKIMGFKVKESV